MMETQKLYGVDGAKRAAGLTVIIDIFRASTVAAFLFDKGVKAIIPVSTREEGFAHKRQDLSVVLVGEEKGIKIPGFDYGNSPYEISKADDLEGKTVVFRSTMGTQGLVNAKKASQIIFGSFVVAGAVTEYIQRHKPETLSVVALDTDGTEDDIFADFLIARATGALTRDIKQIVEYLKTHPNSNKFLDPAVTEFTQEDFYLCLDLDRFHFVPLIQDGKLVKVDIK